MKYRIFDGYTMSYQDRPSHEFVTMKSTEQRDAEGQEAWECDILDCRGDIGVIEWGEYAMRFGLRVGTELRPLGDISGCEVVGNAFQHADLLK